MKDNNNNNNNNTHTQTKNEENNEPLNVVAYCSGSG